MFRPPECMFHGMEYKSLSGDGETAFPLSEQFDAGNRQTLNACFIYLYFVYIFKCNYGKETVKYTEAEKKIKKKYKKQCLLKKYFYICDE